MHASITLVSVLALFTGTLITSASQAKDYPTGYTNTPFLPNSQWRVHDDARPRPVVIEAGLPSTNDKVGTAPSDAIVLFDGTVDSLKNWLGKDNRKKSEAEAQEQPAAWKVENGYMEVNGTG